MRISRFIPSDGQSLELLGPRSCPSQLDSVPAILVQAANIPPLLRYLLLHLR